MRLIAHYRTTVTMLMYVLNAFVSHFCRRNKINKVLVITEGQEHYSTLFLSGCLLPYSGYFVKQRRCSACSVQVIHCLSTFLGKKKSRFSNLQWENPISSTTNYHLISFAQRVHHDHQQFTPQAVSSTVLIIIH